MQHHFDIELAKEYGMNVAVFLDNLSFWIVKNQANNKHCHDGRYWTYNSVDAFVELFPYWSKKQIEGMLSKCKEFGLIQTGNYNLTPYDRTNWYALTDFGHKLLNVPISPKGEMEILENGNQFPQKGKPIPDTKPDTNHILNTPQTPLSKNDIELPTWLPKNDWKDFVEHRKYIKAPLSDNAAKRAIKSLESLRHKGHNISKVIDQSIVNGWKGLFAVKTTEHSAPQKKMTKSEIHWNSVKGSLKGTKYDPECNPSLDPFHKGSY